MSLLHRFGILSACVLVAFVSACSPGSTPTPACTSVGPVTFRLQGASYWAESSFSVPGDGVWWYSVANADGSPVAAIQSNVVTCATCEATGSAIGASCGRIPAGGITAEWDGMVHGASTCSASGVHACDQPSCAPAGHYVVTMCGFHEVCNPAMPSPSNAAVCIHVPFDLPATGEVVGTLP